MEPNPEKLKFSTHVVPFIERGSQRIWNGIRGLHFSETPPIFRQHKLGSVILLTGVVMLGYGAVGLTWADIEFHQSGRHVIDVRTGLPPTYRPTRGDFNISDSDPEKQAAREWAFAETQIGFAVGLFSVFAMGKKHLVI